MTTKRSMSIVVFSNMRVQEKSTFYLVIIKCLFLDPTCSHVCVHPWRVHSDHGVSVPGRHARRHAPQICQSRLLHPLLQESVHNLPLDGHRYGFWRHALVHWSLPENVRSTGGPAYAQGQESGLNRQIFFFFSVQIHQSCFSILYTARLLILRVPLSPSSCIVPPCVTMQLLFSGGTALHNVMKVLHGYSLTWYM